MILLKTINGLPHVVPLLLAMLLMLPVTKTHADGELDIQSIKITATSKNQYKADGFISFQLSKTLQKALTHGVPLKANIDFDLGEHRSWWWNSQKIVSKIVYELKYHALSKHYVLKRIKSGQHWSFSNLPAALQQMGKIHNHQLPVLPSAIQEGRHYLYITARIGSESRNLPFKIQSYFKSNKYQLKSEGVLWALP